MSRRAESRASRIQWVDIPESQRSHKVNSKSKSQWWLPKRVDGVESSEIFFLSGCGMV